MHIHKMCLHTPQLKEPIIKPALIEHAKHLAVDVVLQLCDAPRRVLHRLPGQAANELTYT